MLQLLEETGHGISHTSCGASRNINQCEGGLYFGTYKFACDQNVFWSYTLIRIVAISGTPSKGAIQWVHLQVSWNSSVSWTIYIASDQYS